MISVLSALRNQKTNKVCVWVFEEPTGLYWQKVKPLIQVSYIRKPSFDALNNKSEEFIAAHLKDYFAWIILSTHGGMVLDLDTLSVKDSTHWADSMNSDLIVSLDVNNPGSIAFPYNNAVCMAKSPGSAVVESLKFFASSLMEQDLIWGLTGPILLSVLASQTDKIASPGHTVFCPFGGHEISQIYEENPKLELPYLTEIVHLYAKASPMFEKVDATFVRNSQSLLARTIKEILPENEWNVVDWNEAKYLSQRGQHYAGLFRAIRQFKPSCILEIGTSAGETAIGLIHAAGSISSESAIAYYGIDLFETGNPSTWAEEFSGNYVPPKMDDVHNRLTRETDAEIRLFGINSNDIKPTDFKSKIATPDLIYIDGGHSIATIRHDWSLAREIAGPNTVIVFDDYFPEMPFIGCKVVVDEIDKHDYDVQIQTESDSYAHPFGRLITQLVVVKPNSLKAGCEKIKQFRACRNLQLSGWANEIMKEVRGND